MLKEGWENHFASRILQRGEEYADDGCVEDLHVSDTEITARVMGTHRYDVEIDLKDGRPVAMHCTCPYAADGNNCKHMAAVLYTLQEDEEFEEEGEAVSVDDNESIADVHALLQQQNKNTLADFLESLAGRDLNIKNQIVTRFSPHISDADKKSLEKEADAVFRSHQDRYGFINWNQAFDFEVEICRFLSDKCEALISSEKYMDAFDLSTYVFIQLAETDIDDDGEIESISRDCWDIWKEILERCNPQERERMRDWFESYTYTDKIVDYMEETLQEFLEEEFTDENNLRGKLDEIDRLLNENRKNTRTPCVYSCLTPVSALQKRIEIMKKLGASEKEVNEFYYKYRNFTEVRNKLIQKAMDKQDTEQAVSLLKEGIDLEKKYGLQAHEYENMLAGIYEKSGRKEEELDLLFRDFMKYRIQDSDRFEKIKSLCPEDKWDSLRDQMLSVITQRDILCEVLAEEGLSERLYQVLETDMDMNLIDQFGKYTGTEHARDMLLVFEKYVWDLAREARNNSAYDRLQHYLNSMCEYEGGSELTAGLAARWVSLYPTRRAMVRMLKDYLDQD